MDTPHIAIIGAGPAGLTAALQLKRYALPAMLFEARQPGGLLWNANLVENYPGFPAGLPGPDLVRFFLQQAESIGVQVIPQAVSSLAYRKSIFSLRTKESAYHCQVVLIATGTMPIGFESGLIPAEAQARVYSEVYPLLEVQDAQIAIVGAGDAAFDYALNLARRNSVAIFNRSDQVRCLPLLQQRAATMPRIAYHPHTRLIQVQSKGDGRLALNLESPSGLSEFTADYLIGALGRRSNLDFISSDLLVKLSILEKAGCLYRIGDVANGPYRQTAIAVGQGLRAAMQIYRRQHMED